MVNGCQLLITICTLIVSKSCVRFSSFSCSFKLMDDYRWMTRIDTSPLPVSQSLRPDAPRAEILPGRKPSRSYVCPFPPWQAPAPNDSEWVLLEMGFTRAPFERNLSYNARWRPSTPDICPYSGRAPAGWRPACRCGRGRCPPARRPPSPRGASSLLPDHLEYVS